MLPKNQKDDKRKTQMNQNYKFDEYVIIVVLEERVEFYRNNNKVKIRKKDQRL